jgi:hypothetical protein
MYTVSRHSLPQDLQVAIIEFTNAVKNGSRLYTHANLEGHLPSPGRGQYYLEEYVGSNRQGGAGVRRIAALVGPKKTSARSAGRAPKWEEKSDGTWKYPELDSGGARRIWRVYFSDDHYAAGSWTEVSWSAWV